ncbi:peptide deformylase [Mesoplasma syrphidae]|uniref:Peptide deformylase n=1 Tax=Mesoplasma syrphidae TaxID=225999 RepID=A0A2K9C8N9_9MOLU|nr:peptide deformylase [Mesoplasma syrphidae]AUF83385.1 peptide deformylase [Mesoplasma syrphidae]
MKLDLNKDLLQKEIPTNKWLVKDSNVKIIRSVSPDVEDPNNLSLEQEDCMNKLIDFVRYSQDPILNSEENDDYLRPAVGLAAPQIGYNYNMFFVRFEFDKVGEEYAIINPKITAKSEQITALEDGEGCLSVNIDHEGIVPRSFKIVVEAFDYFSKQYIELTLRSYRSIVFQHEIEHNQGKLYYDLINKEEPHYTNEKWILI